MSDRENIQQVASRLRGLRDALELTTAQVAEATGIDEQTYLNYESGNFDIPISFVQNLAQRYGVQVPELLFGSSPKMRSYYVTRAGTGARVERSRAYSYESLAEGFADRIMHPFMVTIDPASNDQARPNTHAGQEFNYVVSGRVELHIGSRAIAMSAGDSITFNAQMPHYMHALDGKPAQFLAITHTLHTGENSND